MSNVLFIYNCVPTNAHPLVVIVHDRELSLAGDTNLQTVGNNYTRTSLILTEAEQDILILDGVTPCVLAMAMNWVTTGDIEFIKDLL